METISIYLDDERESPDGAVRTYTVDETIALIKANEGRVRELSLDNDLGMGMKEGWRVLAWIEKQAFHNTLKPIPYIIIHTQNPVAADRMMQMRYNAWKYWEGHGHSRRELVKEMR